MAQDTDFTVTGGGSPDLSCRSGRVGLKLNETAGARLDRLNPVQDWQTPQNEQTRKKRQDQQYHYHWRFCDHHQKEGAVRLLDQLFDLIARNRVTDALYRPG